MSTPAIPAPPQNASATRRGLMTAADKVALDGLVTDVAELEASGHDAVTIGTANGLSLVGQVLSLALAGASAGAMSAADKTKIDAISGTNTGDVTLGAVGSSPSANGASLSGQVLTLQPADASSPGVVTAGAQTFAGAKTFNSVLTSGVSSGSNAFAAATGARWKIGGGSTDYFFSDGATKISAAGNFGVTGYTQLGTRTDMRNDTGIGGYVFTAGVLGSHYVGVNIANASLEIANGAKIRYAGDLAPVTITGDLTSPARAAFRLEPQDAQPTGASTVGDMYVTTAGVLKICTTAGTPGTWVSVGAQS